MNPEAPYYVYERKMIEDACRQLKESLPGFDFLYSVKSNPFPPVLRVVRQQGFGADAASLREVEESLGCGMLPEDVYYSAPGKREKDIRGALGKCVLIADSLHELRMIQRIAAEQGKEERVGLRVHPGFAMGDAVAESSKFGIDMEQLPALRDTLRACPNLKPAGMHVHLKSQVLDAEILAGYYRNVMQLAVELREACEMDMEFINFGAGIGTVYDEVKDRPVDFAKLKAAAQEILAVNRKLHARLLIETGRFVICRAGKYIVPVVDKKMSHGITYLIVANGMNGFMRPAIAALLEKVTEGKTLPGLEPLFTSSHEFRVRVLNGTCEQETVNIVGNLCTPLDIIKNNVTMNRTEIGDLIEITNAGSYACTLSPVQFSGQERPAQYLLTEDGQWIQE